MSKVSLYPDTLYILLEDFNTTISHTLDRLYLQQTHNKTLYHWAQVHNLTEVWRWLFPDSTQFSCYSSMTNSLSRIDVAFANTDLLSQLSFADYLPRGISDHALFSMTLTKNIKGPSKLWRLKKSYVAGCSSSKK